MSNAQVAAETSDWRDEVKSDISAPVRLGLIGVGGFFLIMLLWSVFLPISSAVVAPGTVISEGRNQTLQHPTGGIVAAIHTKDGRGVEAGAPIVTLDVVGDMAELRRLETRLIQQQALLARLEAQLNGKSEIAFPSSFYGGGPEGGLRGSADQQLVTGPLYKTIMEAERREFEARHGRLGGGVESLRAQLRTLERQERGQRATLVSLNKQKQLLAEQVERMRPIVATGHIARNQFNDLERQMSDVTGRAHAADAELQAIAYRKLSLKGQIEEMLSSDRERDSAELSEARARVGELTNQTIAVRQTIRQKHLVAPMKGTVTGLSVHTVGGVVRPGDVIAEIVPSESGVLIEAQVAPLDIDHIHIGQEVNITVTAFNQRIYDPAKGKVEYIAADSVLEERDQRRYFVVRIALTERPEEYEKLNSVKTGMQADVFFETGSRSFLTYVLTPVIDSFRRAFRES